ncbi:flagellar hook protein FlgE [Ochrobactrum sp. GPK 3]|uniref:flagellar hook protein FlgE n=1 Tax=Brucella/Ochrobactrum group TaxID=2826938 RepID=UPI0009924C28|nr:flagellar hook protein FlgE [Brucella haematophila]MBA8822243.1 flagellar hook protein FlgE [Ochrobactrum sp. P6BSIII]OOL14886.1 flagellar hook protein FlgE [Ochrobactrum sp. P6BS-III]TMU89023.1 flagellar hook protein FlgE [Brucella haematophila]
MSLYGMMRTGVSGMNAQANRLSAVADNIANASTIGYKRAETQFSSLVLPSSGGQYNSGSVLTSVRYGISDQGGIRSTSSTTDLAIDGNGYFLVQGADGATYLTRAGSFVPDKDGNLVNTAGYYLLGSADGSVAPDLNGLSIVNVNAPDLTAIGSTAGTFTVNLPTTDTPPATAGDYNHKTSLISYNNAGEAVKLDVYFTKNADDTWSVSVKNAADNVEIGTGTLTFDPVTGAVVSGGNVSVDLTGYNGGTLDLNLGASTARTGSYTISQATINGQAPSSLQSVDVGADGSVVAIYENGSQQVLYRLPLATVASPDRMTVVSGNVFSPSAASGAVTVGYPQSDGMGKIMSGSLEESNADIAQELTDMIEAQRSYTANSKVFQTGSELMDVLVNLKR